MRSHLWTVSQRFPGRFGAALALALGVTLAAPCSAQLFGDSETRTRVEELRKRLDAQQSATEERLARIETRLGEAGAPERRAIIDIAGQIEALRGELARLRGQVEVLVHQIETGEKRQKDFYLDIDTRLRKVELAQQAPPPAEKPAAAEPPAPTGDTKAYEAALNQFKLGNYPLAISAFQGFLVTYPSSTLAPSAQYWIGNAHYAQREYKGAIAAQQKLIASWPDNAKVPDAMLNIASSQEAMGDRRGAQRTLESIVQRYPDTPAGASAKQRLSQGARR